MSALGDLGEYIREQRTKAKVSLRQLAAQAGVSNPYLSQIERGLRKPSAEVLQQIATALRISTPVMYLRAGLLEDRENEGVVAAIAHDPVLTDRQRQILTEVYESFCRENKASTVDTPARPTAVEKAVAEAVATTPPAGTKAAAKPAATKKAATKTAATKTAATKTAATKTAATKTAATKTAATKTAATKTAATKSVATKPAATKSAVKKTPATNSVDEAAATTPPAPGPTG
jgi:transcriptional regulator with XRE-family HTH domain